MAGEIEYDGLLHYLVNSEETEDPVVSIMLTYCGKRMMMRIEDGMEHLLAPDANKCATCWPPGDMGPGNVVHRADLNRN